MATAAASLIATSTGGSVTVTDADPALLVNINAAKGVTLTDVAAVTNLDVVAGGAVSVTNTGAGELQMCQLRVLLLQPVLLTLQQGI